jgi:DNA primase
MNYRRLSFTEALHVLGAPVENISPAEYKRLKSPSEPPDWDWQQAAERIVSVAEETLWSSEGEPALAYLLERGLTTGTIRSARLGYVPGDFRQWRKVEGLEAPCGITIPWFASGALWAIKVRRAAGMPKYQQVRGGSANGLYGADHLLDRDVALFCEGEFDALLAQQEAGDLVTAVTLGSATTTLSARWYAELATCRVILVVYDRDQAGRQGANRLMALSPRFQCIQVPHGKDISEFYANGGDIYRWIEAELNSVVRRKRCDNGKSDRQETATCGIPAADL